MPDILWYYEEIALELPDPAALQGTEEENLKETREIRDAIKTQIVEWVKTID